MERTFNCGLLLIDARLTGKRTYSDLLALVSPETWRSTETVHSDQFILNRYFAGRQTLVSAAYNYRLHIAGGDPGTGGTHGGRSPGRALLGAG